MAHNHSHGGCHDESDHHDHQHGLPEDIGHRDNLYARIDRANVVALNAEDPEMGPAVIKPWDQRLDEETVRIILPSLLGRIETYSSFKFNDSI